MLALAFTLLYLQFGSASISDITAALANAQPGNWLLHGAALLLTMAAPEYLAQK